uniref:Centrosomal CEP44 domain-containing protein n=1 Tax=Timema poppense TaxID=170557 RepID=A0A7R9CX32_TIMPO|nr:unnamed protein product [Timema poppensis]
MMGKIFENEFDSYTLGGQRCFSLLNVSVTVFLVLSAIERPDMNKTEHEHPLMRRAETVNWWIGAEQNNEHILLQCSVKKTVHTCRGYVCVRCSVQVWTGLKAVSSGDPWLYVMLYQHLFFEHSALVASTIARGVSPGMFQQGAAGNQRNALTVIFQILRNVFNYNPPLTAQQFSSTNKYSKIKVNKNLYSYVSNSSGLVKPVSGRSERLVSMCLDVLKLIMNLQQLMKNKKCISNSPTSKEPGDLPQPHLNTEHITTITHVEEVK